VRLWDKIQRHQYWQEAQTKRPTVRNFNGTTPGFTKAEAAQTLAQPLKRDDNLNVAILQMTTSGRMFGVSDMKGFNEAHPNMDYAGWLGLDEKNRPLLGVDLVTCAHVGNNLGERYVYGYQYLLVEGIANQLAVWRIDMTQPDGGVGTKLVREWLDQTKLPYLNRIPYMHTFANTDNYLIFVGSVFQYHISEIATHTRMLHSMNYHGDENNTLYVFEKSSGRFVKSFTSDAFWFYHLVNCYEEGDNVVLDINSVDYRHIETAFANEKLRYDYPAEFEDQPTLQLVIDVSAPDGTHFSPTVLGPSYDLGTIHPNLHGQKYQYAWGLKYSGEHLWWDTIIKHDVTSNQILATWKRDDHYPGELNCVPKPGADREDDVVILTIVLGGDYGTSYLLALDGRDLSPIAEARSPFPLPFGSHGCWQPADKSRGCWGQTTADPFGEPFSTGVVPRTTTTTTTTVGCYDTNPSSCIGISAYFCHHSEIGADCLRTCGCCDDPTPCQPSAVTVV